MEKRGRPPKNPSDCHLARLDLRITAADKAAFQRAAELDERVLADWVRNRLRRAAEAELARKGKKRPL